MLYLVGLGLADETDITVKGLNVVKSAHRVYLEAYTSVLLIDQEKLVLTFDVACIISRADSRALVGSVLWPIRYIGRPRDGRILQ